MSSQQPALFAMPLVVLAALLCGLGREARADETFGNTVAPFLKQYCLDCHEGDEPEGELALDQFANLTSVLKQRTVWYKIQKVLRSAKMPPKDETKPNRDEVERMIRWINTDVLKLDCQGPQDPGRVTLRRLNRTEYNNTIRDLVGVDFEPGKDFPADDVGYGFDNNGDVLTMSPLLMEKYMAAAEKIARTAIVTRGPLDAKPAKLPESHRRIIFTTPSGSGRSVQDCARDVLRRFASRAYRRDVSDRELERLLRLVRLADSHGESYERCMALAVQALLVSPQFLFRIEHDQFPNSAERSHLISQFELATRLSYFLWSTMPDEELFKQARDGTLRKNLDAQVRRMMKDEKSRALVENFAGQWLELRKLDMVTPDPKLFPDYNARLRDAMRTESEMFFAEVKNRDLSVLTFLDGNFSFLNERLARHYGISGVRGEKFRRVSLQGTERGGVLTHASILTVTSNPTRTSPVKRGKWIMEQILGTPPPPPPPDVVLLSEDADAIASASLRKRMEIHRTNPSCAVCHDQMDALGFGFENFDAIGRWRIKDGTFDIDSSGVLPGGKKFAGARELKQVLKTSQSGPFIRCLAEKMLTYATGRGVEFYDKCALDQITGGMAGDENRFSSLILHIVHSEPFQKRRARREP